MDCKLQLESVTAIQNKPTSRDRFGFAKVWLPIGTPGTIKGDDRDYEVTREDLENEISLESLAGIDVTVWHPEAGITTVSDFARSVGVVLGKTRWNEETQTLEVLTKIKDSETIMLVESGMLRETSAGYLFDPITRNRLYNHIALVPTGYARGGRNMIIKTESLPKMEITLESIKEAVLSGFDLIDANEKTIKESYDAGFKAGELAAAETIKTESLKADVAAKMPSLNLESFTVEQMAALIVALNVPAEVKEDVKAEITTESIPELSFRSESTPAAQASATTRKRPARKGL